MFATKFVQYFFLFIIQILKMSTIRHEDIDSVELEEIISKKKKENEVVKIISPVLIWLKFLKILMEDIILLHRELLLYSKMALIFKLTNLNTGFNFIKEGRF